MIYQGREQWVLGSVFGVSFTALTFGWVTGRTSKFCKTRAPFITKDSLLEQMEDEKREDELANPIILSLLAHAMLNTDNI